MRGTDLASLVARAGAQPRTAPLAAFAGTVTGFLHLTAEREFLDGARTIVTSVTTLPALPIRTQLGRASRATYGQVEAGLRADIIPVLSATLAGGTSVARAGGDGFAVSGGLTMRFRPRRRGRR